VFDCVRVDAGSTWRAGTRADAGGGVRGATPEVRFRGPHGLPEPRVRARRGGSPPAAHDPRRRTAAPPAGRVWCGEATTSGRPHRRAFPPWRVTSAGASSSVRRRRRG